MSGSGQGPAVLVNARPAALARIGKDARAHKYSHGHALILAGGVGQGGAARLAARGALRIGAGLVTLGCPPAAVAENAAQLNAIMIRPVDGAGALSALLQDQRLNAICLGPGLGRTAQARALVMAALRAARPTVLDADALTLFQDDPGALFARLHEACVLTPHAGEFARLFPDLARTLGPDVAHAGGAWKHQAALAAARRAGCTVLLKGAATVVAGAGGALCEQNRPAPWLATAGSGDVLAGFVAGLLARGFAPDEAAETAVWLHVETAQAFGPGLIAEDLPETLPVVLGRLDR